MSGIKPADKFPSIHSILAGSCLSFQDNGYADKLEAYHQACSALGLKQPGLSAALATDLKDYGVLSCCISSRDKPVF